MVPASMNYSIKSNLSDLGARGERVKDEVARARALIDRATSILIIAHTRPDGDAVGSLLALAGSLAASGKRVTPVLADGVPSRFRFLPGADTIRSDVETDVDALIAVDCSDLERLGLSPEKLPRQPDLNIDHHPTNTRFAEINLVETEAAATCEMLYDLMMDFGLPIDVDVATNLLAGIVTDTIGFRTENVRPRTLQVAARLLRHDPPLATLYERTLLEHEFNAMHYWGQALTKLKRDEHLIWTTMTSEDRKRAGYTGEDDADLINLLTTVEGAWVTIIFIEQKQGKVKVSWRSRGGVDVASLATKFGGGGHRQAAGAMVEGGLSDVVDRVLKDTRRTLKSGVEQDT
jgi:phosphoesterase RecJ-like protein